MVLENKESLEKEILEKISSSIVSIVNTGIGQLSEDKPIDTKIIDDFSTIIPFDELSKKQLAKQLEMTSSMEQKVELLNNIAKDLYSQRKKQLGIEIMGQVERYVTLSVIDTLWMDHLDAV